MLYINGWQQHLIYFVIRGSLVWYHVKWSLEVSNQGSSYSKAKGLNMLIFYHLLANNAKKIQ